MPATGRVLRYALIEIMPNGRRFGSNSRTNTPSASRATSRTAMAASPSVTITTAMARSCPDRAAFYVDDRRRFASPGGWRARRAARPLGALDVNGLQGNGTWRIRRDNEPPLESYFIDYADEYDDPAERGHRATSRSSGCARPRSAPTFIPFGGAPRSVLRRRVERRPALHHHRSHHRRTRRRAAAFQ